MQMIFEKISGGQGGEDTLKMVYDELRTDGLPGVERILAREPKLMILDEPFSGFDPVNADLIRKEILRLRDEGATVILSTHNMESVEELCDNIALIDKSRVVITGGTDDIRRRFGEDNVAIEYTDDAMVRKSEVVSRSAVNGRLLELIDGGARINSFQELIPRMNDIFIKLVTEGEAVAE